MAILAGAHTAERPLCSDQEAVLRGFGDADSARRREYLRETIIAIEQSNPLDGYHRLYHRNLCRWRAQSDITGQKLRLEVLPGDCGDATRSQTRNYGVCFTVLNIADACVPGSAYVEGAVAHKLNMFHCTDFHFRVSDD